MDDGKIDHFIVETPRKTLRCYSAREATFERLARPNKRFYFAMFDHCGVLPPEKLRQARDALSTYKMTERESQQFLAVLEKYKMAQIMASQQKAKEHTSNKKLSRRASTWC